MEIQTLGSVPRYWVRSSRNTCAIFVILVSFVTLAKAQDTTRPATDFSRGTWALELEVAYAHSFDAGHARFETGSFGVGYYLVDNFSLNFRAAGFWDQQPGEDAVLAEGDLMFRHHLINIDRFSMFMEFGAGISTATAPVPVGGTYFNFTLQTGPGVAFRLTDNLHLVGGARYLHLSNARLRGPIHNPSINALEGYVGLMFTF